ncbi:cytochrome P450 [Roridomyces roridus]|uniref:Cytochrome P450 n=1 Tax=Roridomyces roridus TaxID=1738132 RepID=A0AAD7BYU7_9AGAR|nr:cytochrome P450 [Roridomyces roridus]
MTSSTISAVAVAALGIILFHLLRSFLSNSGLDSIPSVGVPKGPFGFYIGAWRYIKNSREITEQGFRKYPGRAFKVALNERWLVVISGRALLDDLNRAPDAVLSTDHGTKSLLHHDYSLGWEQFHDLYHVDVVKTALTRNIGVRFPELRAEVIAAFDELIPATTNEWLSLPAMQTMQTVVSRISNCLFVGPDCRNADYIKLTTDFTQNALKEAVWLHILPAFLRPIAYSLFGGLNTYTRAVLRHLGPMIRYRIEMHDKYGRDWPNDDRPNDLISWLLDETNGRPDRRTLHNLTHVLLNLNFGAIHTTTQGLLHALYTLASSLEYVQPLREEIQAVTRTEGWSKAALSKMVKLDSFLKESARYTPGFSVNIFKEAQSEFTFSDGTTVPAGTLIAVPVLAEHRSEANYTHPNKFEPWRFADMRDEAGEGIRHQMVTPTPDFLAFGIGRHACPGRFFAVNMLKLIMAHMILTYDFKLKDGVRPLDEWTSVVSPANSTAEIMFKRRS